MGEDLTPSPSKAGGGDAGCSFPSAAILLRGHRDASSCKLAPALGSSRPKGLLPPPAAPGPRELQHCSLGAGQGLRDVTTTLGAFITTDAKMTIKES